MFILRNQVQGYILNANVDERLPIIYYYLPYLWISLAGLLFFKSTNKGQDVTYQIVALILTPMIFSPVLAVIYVIMILLPIYGIVGGTL